MGRPSVAGLYGRCIYISTCGCANFGVQGYGLLRTDAGGFPHNWTFEGGYMHPGDRRDWALSSMKTGERRNIRTISLFAGGHGRRHTVELLERKMAS